jgi:hypothetical protein
MSEARCPSCGQVFDNHRDHRPETLRSRLLFGPERLIAKARQTAADRDTCPHCGNEFVSEDFALFGKFARARLQSLSGVYALAGLLIAATLAAIWISAR